MNKIGVKIDGKKYIVNYPITEQEFQNQVMEIIGFHHYGEARVKGTIVDLGANIGLASLYFLKNADNIHAVEPSKKLYDTLKKNVSKYKKIKTHNVAIGCMNTKDYLYGLNDGIPQTLVPYKSVTSRELVDVVRLDDFFKENKIDHVNAMKIDIESAEYMVFPSESFANVADRIDLIVGEGHYHKQGFPGAIPLMLDEYGFKTKFKDTQNYIKHLEFTDPVSGNKKKYEIKMNTMFVARKNGKTT